MSFFDRFKAKITEVSQTARTEAEIEPRLQAFVFSEQIKDPHFLVLYLGKVLVFSSSFDEDFSRGPSSEAILKIGGTEEDRRRIANEEVLLRALGCCLYVKKTAPNTYFQAFRAQLSEWITRRMGEHGLSAIETDARHGLDQYLDDFAGVNEALSFTKTYVSRVYADEILRLLMIRNPEIPLHAFEGVVHWFKFAHGFICAECGEKVAIESYRERHDAPKNQ